MNANAEQIAYWNDEAGARWAALHERTDAAFSLVTKTALDAANPQADEAVLDVGCGCGETVLELARRVGRSGSAVGVDVSKAMLDVAAERVQRDRAANVTLLLGDASTHPFDEGAFDLVFSRFGVMFFDAPVDAFANIKRSLRDGGRLTFICWRELSANPWFFVPLAAAKPFVAPQPPMDPESPGPLAFADADRVRRILQQAGFTSIEVKRHDTMMRLSGPDGLESAANFATQIGPVSRALAGADANVRSSVRSAILETLREHETPEGVFLAASVWIVSARA
jgi:SAM-dependent methyltransferase